MHIGLIPEVILAVNIDFEVNKFKMVVWSLSECFLVTSAEEGGDVFTSVCLSVRRITEKVVNGF